MATKFEPGITYSCEEGDFIAVSNHELAGFQNGEFITRESQDPQNWTREAKKSVSDLIRGWGVKLEVMDAYLEPYFQPSAEAKENEHE